MIPGSLCMCTFKRIHSELLQFLLAHNSNMLQTKACKEDTERMLREELEEWEKIEFDLEMNFISVFH